MFNTDRNPLACSEQNDCAGRGFHGLDYTSGNPMHLDARSTEQLHIDQAVARARLFQRLLNETLDELAEHRIHCLSVNNPRRHDRTFHRVELLLLFLAQKAAA